MHRRQLGIKEQPNSKIIKNTKEKWFFSDGSGRSFRREERMREERRGGELMKIVRCGTGVPRSEQVLMA